MRSRRKTTITGRQIFGETPIIIKPAKSRKIIRRFHFLINKRHLICEKLGITLSDDDEQANKQIIDHFLNDEMKLEYELGVSCTDGDERLLKSHTLYSQKELVQCLGYIMNEIYNHGGLSDYQLASRAGQALSRGGDSSKILVRWSIELGLGKSSLSTLEIGSLSTKNRISTCAIFTPIVRIDLQSSHPGIQKQDFMLRPLPKNDDEKFDLISCSLVLNFVPTPIQRGQMCMRFHQFLKHNGFLFIVLPLPCINHSRYLNKNYFIQLMASLGYLLINYHEARKLCYILLRHQKPINMSSDINDHDECINKFTKKHKLYDKPGLNNFSIILSSKHSHHPLSLTRS